jgi:uncharacterized protein YkwD
VALLTLLPTAPAGAATGPRATAAGSFGDAILRQLNSVRARYHLPAVRADRRMNDGASAHSRDMAAKGYVAHGSWTGRVRAAASRARSVGEVIGWLDQADPQREAVWIVNAWLGSSIHRHVLLSGDFRRVGIGRAGGSFSGQPVALYTVDFASAR